MQLDIHRRYKLKDGAFPTYGLADYGTEDLVILAIETDDLSLMVKPHGFSPAAIFWVAVADLEED